MKNRSIVLYFHFPCWFFSFCTLVTKFLVWFRYVCTYTYASARIMISYRDINCWTIQYSVPMGLCQQLLHVEKGPPLQWHHPRRRPCNIFPTIPQHKFSLFFQNPINTKTENFPSKYMWLKHFSRKSILLGIFSFQYALYPIKRKSWEHKLQNDLHFQKGTAHKISIPGSSFDFALNCSFWSVSFHPCFEI